MFGLSKLIYNSSVLVIQKNLMKEIEKLIFSFIWDGKPAKIKKSTIIGERKRCGLKMTDFNTMIKALKVAWIPRLQSRTNASRKIIPEAAMQNLGGLSFLTYCNYDVNSLQINNLPVFYRKVLKQWQSSKHAFWNDTPPHKEIIWNNRNIMIESKPLFYKCWFENNIIRVEDLLDNNGNFLSLNHFSGQYQLKTPFTLYFGLISSILPKGNQKW